MINVAIVGAGPYGLSVAAHLRSCGIPFRIFGRIMDSWLDHMPEGMKLKSDGFASSIYDPESKFTLKKFCASRGIEYGDTGVPVRLQTFTDYGIAFRDQMVPELEDKMVVSIEPAPQGFTLRLDSGEVFDARNVVLAVGITHFAFVPSVLTGLQSEFVSHSYNHKKLDDLVGQSVAVVGGGASALDLAALLREKGVDVQLISRRESLKFHSVPTGKPRSRWQRLRHPQSGLGPGMRSWFFSYMPAAFYWLPKRLRLHLVRTTLGPSGGWFVKETVMTKVPLMLGHTPVSAKVEDGKVRLRVAGKDGAQRDVVVDRVIAATGYRVDIDRLQFLSPEIRSRLARIDGSPELSTRFESSMPGLYFVGVAAANTFGPLMRFAYGANFSARSVATAMMKSVAKQPVFVPASSVRSEVTTTE